MTVFSFVGYVSAMIVRGQIMRGLREQIFAMGIVDSMCSNDLQLVAGESPDATEERRSLQSDIKRLQDARQVLEDYGTHSASDAF